MSALRYAIDHLAAKNGRLLAWGWILPARQRVRALAIRVEGPGGASRRFTADLGLDRPDVAAAFRDEPRAAASGFSVTGFVEAPVTRAWLEVRGDDGDEDIDISSLLHSESRRPSLPDRARAAWRAAWRRVRANDWRGLVQRLRERRGGGATDGEGLARRWLPLLPAGSRLCVVLDHGMGGGANRYREQLVAERLAAGEPVLLLTYRIAALSYEAQLLRPGMRAESSAVDDVACLAPFLLAGRVEALVVNSPVSFDDPAGLAVWLAQMRARVSFRLLVTVHDFFAVCRSFVLVDASGRHCGVPDIAACERCMAANTGSFMNLSPPTPIREWRAAWSRCLQAADEIRCFSRSSRDLLLRAYPDLPAGRITVIPHDTGDIAFAPPRHDPSAPLVVGIIGQVSAVKGAHVVAELARLAETSPDGMRIVVIGTLEPPAESPRLLVTGRYRREDLPALVERHGVNMLFFPSIWPETFSYVVAEMMALKLPIVAFDLGAPAERLRTWPLARLCPQLEAGAAYETLVAYHRERATQAA